MCFAFSSLTIRPIGLWDFAFFSDLGQVNLTIHTHTNFHTHTSVYLSNVQPPTCIIALHVYPRYTEPTSIQEQSGSQARWAVPATLLWTRMYSELLGLVNTHTHIHSRSACMHMGCPREEGRPHRVNCSRIGIVYTAQFD